MPTPHSRPTAHLLDSLAEAEWARRQQPPTGAGASARVGSAPRPPIRPTTRTVTANPLRPRTLDEVVGQEKLKPLLRRLVDASLSSGRALDHMLFVGDAGTGKTTLSTVIANELRTRVFELKAPLDTAALMELREVIQPRDVVFVDEIHLQVSGDRRGITQACDPEAFYAVLEDGVLATTSGPLPFPKVTWIGATTDVGLLPVPLTDRFAIKPRLAAYAEAEMVTIAERNAQALGLVCDPGVCELLAGASRGVPREINNYMKSAGQLSQRQRVDVELAREVVEDLNSTTLDGLTDSMQMVLRFLYQHGRRVRGDGTVRYQASVNTLATACGHGRDTKAINLLVEPYLLRSGLLEVQPQGRTLTPAGVTRARQLIGER